MFDEQRKMGCDLPIPNILSLKITTIFPLDIERRTVYQTVAICALHLQAMSIFQSSVMTVMAIVDERWSMKAATRKRHGPAARYRAFEDTMRLRVSRVGNDIEFK